MFVVPWNPGGDGVRLPQAADHPVAAASGPAKGGDDIFGLSNVFGSIWSSAQDGLANAVKAGGEKISGQVAAWAADPFGDNEDGKRKRLNGGSGQPVRVDDVARVAKLGVLVLAGLAAVLLVFRVVR